MLTIKNPASGKVLRELPEFDPALLPEAFMRARAAQRDWAKLSVRKRARYLIQLREILIAHADEVIDLLSQENGKPRFEALANEILPVCDTLTYFAKVAPKLLRDRNIKLGLMKHRRSTINYWPMGVVAVISPGITPFCSLLPRSSWHSSPETP